VTTLWTQLGRRKNERPKKREELMAKRIKGRRSRGGSDGNKKTNKREGGRTKTWKEKE
jgi:hypothetical protein